MYAKEVLSVIPIAEVAKSRTTNEIVRDNNGRYSPRKLASLLSYNLVSCHSFRYSIQKHENIGAIPAFKTPYSTLQSAAGRKVTWILDNS